MKKYYLESWSRGISYIKYINGKANWTGHTLGRNCLLQRVIEGKIKGDKSGRKTRKKT